MKNIKRNNKGFARTRSAWVPEGWDNGYVDNKGRVRIYRPDYPRAYAEGYALRYHVVWWLHTGEVHPVGTELHHKDGSTDNDVFENLIVLTKSEHRSLHRNNWVEVECKFCGKKFLEHAWRITSRGRKYCSNECYQSKPRTQEHKDKISEGNRISWENRRR